MYFFLLEACFASYRMALKLTISYYTRRYSGGLKDNLLYMNVKDKEKLNNPMKGWQILNAISLMVFCTVHCTELNCNGTLFIVISRSKIKT